MQTRAFQPRLFQSQLFRGFLFGAAIAMLLAGATLPSRADDELSKRTELKRVDLSGAPGMEVVTSIVEIKPGGSVIRHVHHGVETGIVLQGAMVQLPGKEPTKMETGAPILNLRDVPHGGFTVVGDTTLRLLTVHIVDKGKPLYDEVK
jgi:quercetin dioxygenase-like cupin family protein